MHSIKPRQPRGVQPVRSSSGVLLIHVLYNKCFHETKFRVPFGEGCPSAGARGNPALTAGGVWWCREISSIPGSEGDQGSPSWRSLVSRQRAGSLTSPCGRPRPMAVLSLTSVGNKQGLDVGLMLSLGNTGAPFEELAWGNDLLTSRAGAETPGLGPGVVSRTFFIKYPLENRGPASLQGCSPSEAENHLNMTPNLY